MIKSETTQNYALALRSNQTMAEKIIWSLVRRQQLAYKFKRQQPIDHYICDFVCFEKRLIIEIDGGQHSYEKDKIRTQYLENNGFVILRFWNNDVLSNKEGIYNVIREKLK